jgi:hypothetical protein
MKLVSAILVLSIFFIAIVTAQNNNNEKDQSCSPSEYDDVYALQGIAKQEILAIARLLRARPEMAIDQTKVSGEFCLKSGMGTMIHFASDPSSTSEDIVYQFDATELIKAGLKTDQLSTLPPLGKMEPGKWYFLPLNTSDPHHQHTMATPIIAIAVNVK